MSEDSNQVDQLRSYCLALALILQKHGLVTNDEFPKYLNQAIHLLDQKRAQVKEEAIENMSKEEKQLYNLFPVLFGLDANNEKDCPSK